ncbi:hypothetical protein L1887_27235 [Cichorium endivia]|nr:hypothetical protein L1887_27235 [Cichorium endivia]
MKARTCLRTEGMKATRVKEGEGGRLKSDCTSTSGSNNHTTSPMKVPSSDEGLFSEDTFPSPQFIQSGIASSKLVPVLEFSNQPTHAWRRL